MFPVGKLLITKAPQEFKGVYSNLYICEDINGNEFIFKELKDKQLIINELVANAIARLININVLDFITHKSIEGKQGILMNYIKDSILLSKYKRLLDKKQLQNLKNIILFDLLIGNKDRHTANILVVNNKLTAFDHVKIFENKNLNSCKFIKLEIGRLLDKTYIKKLESCIKKKMTTKKFLLNIGFKEKDFNLIKNIDNEKLRKIVNKNQYNYLIFRKENFDKILYC